jgi:hypothetical protein
MKPRAILLALAGQAVWVLSAFAETPKWCESPNRTQLFFKLATGERVVISLERSKDEKKCLGWCVTGGAVHNHSGILTRGVVTEGMFVDGKFYFRIQWMNKKQDESVFGGTIDKGEGSGTQYVNWQGNSSTWTATTVEGCDKWPEGPNPIRQQPAQDKIDSKRSGAAEAIAPSPKIKAGRPRSIDALRLVPDPRQSPDAAMPTGRPASARAILGDPVPQPSQDKLTTSKKRKLPLDDTSKSGGCSSAMDRLSGDCMGGGVSASSRLPGTSRGPAPGSQAGTRGSSGASTARSSSGFDGVQGGSSSGSYMVQSSGNSARRESGGAIGSGFRSENSGMIRLNERRNIEALKQHIQQQNDDWKYRVK